MILKKFDLELPLNDDILLKLYSDSTIALYDQFINYIIMLRNVTGKDDREKKLLQNRSATRFSSG